MKLQYVNLSPVLIYANGYATTPNLAALPNEVVTIFTFVTEEASVV
jgi:hypothetical protein